MKRDEFRARVARMIKEVQGFGRDADATAEKITQDAEEWIADMTADAYQAGVHAGQESVG